MYIVHVVKYEKNVFKGNGVRIFKKKCLEKKDRSHLQLKEISRKQSVWNFELFDSRWSRHKGLDWCTPSSFVKHE